MILSTKEIQAYNTFEIFNEWILFISFYPVELNEEKHKELIEKKEMEISELNAKLRSQEKEKQNEIIKLQLEVSVWVC